MNRVTPEWISGFSAGEGCFGSNIDKSGRIYAYFVIHLRADDYKILLRIKKLFDTGIVSKLFESGHGRNPAARYLVNNLSDLYHVIIQHFDKYPLLNKKQDDYIIWRELVDYLYHDKHKTNKIYAMELHNKLREIKKYKRSL